MKRLPLMVSGHHGRWGFETAGQKKEGMARGINCHKVRLKEGKEGEGACAGAASTAAACKRAEQRKGKERKKKGRQQVGSQCQ
jgi:hypothetical protein